MDPKQVSTDLLQVGTDLSEVPFDEVLDFRKGNGAYFAAYAAGLRQFLATQASLSTAEREQARDERSQQFSDQAAELRRISRAAFGLRSSTLLLSLTGAAWSGIHGDRVAALLAGLAAAAQSVPAPEQTVTAYSYLLRTRQLR